MKDFPDKFAEYSEARKNGFIELKNLKEQGKNVVGVFCAYTPCEIIQASGAVVVELCGVGEETIPDAEAHLPRNLCPLIKSSYGFALTEKCPFFYFSDFIIGDTTCDGKKKMYEHLGKLKPVHIMQLPQTYKSQDSFVYWENQLKGLKKKLEKYFNIIISDDALRQSIHENNKERIALRNFLELGKLDPPPVSGYELLKISSGSEFIFDREEVLRDLEEITEKIKVEYEAGGYSNAKPGLKRILVTGCPLGESTEKVIKAIEESGAVVVCFENCGGSKTANFLVDEEEEPIKALAEKYLNIACSCMSPNDNRINLLSELIDDYKVDGVVDVILQACHTYNVETNRIKNFVNKEKNVPYLSIETDYSQKDTGQIKTRVEAFIEMI